MNKILMSLFLLTNLSLAKEYTGKAFDKELSQFNYPFEVKTFSFNSQNQSLDMRYMDIGNKESQKIVTLLHGKNFSGFYWERIANDLVEKGYRVIIPDQIGFGKSSKPERYQYSFTQFALNTKNLLEKLKIDKFSVVGHSMGGMLAVNMSYLFSSSIDKLVLINPIGLETYLDYVKYKETNFFHKIEMKKTVDKIRNYQKKNYYDGKWNSEYEKLLKPFKGWFKGNEWQNVAWSNALTYSPIFNEDIVSKLKKISNKTFLIIGTRDRTGPGRNWKKDGVTYKLGQYQILGKEAHRRIRGSKLFELGGLGHMPQFEDYTRFEKVFFPIF